MSSYDSTARSLALPISPPRSPELSNQTVRPSWRRRRSSTSRHIPTYQERLKELYHSLDRWNHRLIALWRKLTPLQQVFVGTLVIVGNVLGILFLIYHNAVFKWLVPKAESWRQLPFGWVILWLATISTAFPPMFGYSTCVTIGGFVYGFPNGWYVVASANVIGSLLAFIVFRNLLSNFAHKLYTSDARFSALNHVLKHDGLKLLIMIRLCPLPYSLSNAAISTFQTVEPLSFAIATAIAAPKLLIHVFIGAKIAEIATSGDKMPLGTKVINYASIAFGVLLGIGTGIWVYRSTMKRARMIEAEERDRSDVRTQRAGRRSQEGLMHPDEFVEDEGYEEGSGSEVLNDDIDFLDPEAGLGRYKDENDVDSEDDGLVRDGTGRSIGLGKR